MLTLWREGGEPLTAGTREITHRIRRSGLRPPSPPLPSVPESDGEAVVATPVQVTGYAVYNYAGVDRDGITSFAASEDLERVVKVIDIALEYANDNYEADVLPGDSAARQRRA